MFTFEFSCFCFSSCSWVSQLTELEANSRHQEAESSSNVREYERALTGVQQEVTAYQTVLAQTQV